jgi:DMSO/TMAO reductase YedYZ molybdopterin-dependent catalytic subunit
VTTTALTSTNPARSVTTSRAAIAGIAATAIALGVSELLAGLLAGATSLVAAVGQALIDAQPAGAKDVAVALFGTNDKLAFELLIVAIAIAIGAGIGVLARRNYPAAVAVFVGFGVIGFLAALRDPLVSAAMAGAAAAVSIGVGIWVLGWLLDGAANTVGTPGATVATTTGPISPREARSARTPGMPDWSRRSFLVRSGAVIVGATVAGYAGRTLLERQRVAPDAGSTPIPPSSETVTPPGPEADLSTSIAGLTPIVMPNDRFYRIDTALLTPSVDAATWSLRIHGMVDRETTLTFEELVGLPMFEQFVTISCVSNEVGGDLVGNAKWTGVRLRDVLDLAGVQAGATQLVGRSVDGWTAGMPTAWVMDPGREPMIAVKMNDVPLPPAHGYPARLIVPGLYGYVSATKWLAELELTTLEGFDGYWIPRGWAKDAPILTQSRIDTPLYGAGLTPGRVPVAGIAWAPDRGVTRVEVGIDGTWHDAELSHPISDATWVQWVYYWEATPGEHRVQVRATDGTGETQTESRTPPAPDGARGWHTIQVKVG